MVDLGLLKSGKVELQSTIDQGNLRQLLVMHCKKLTLIVRNLFSVGMRILQGTERLHDRTGQLVSENLQGKAHFENFVMGSDATEFVNKVKDQVRNRQKRMSKVAESCNEHSIIWRMFMATALNAATFMGKNFSTIQSVVKNHGSLTLKQMFDVTAQLVNKQEEINCLDKILYGKNTWTHLSLIHDEVVISLQRTKVYLFCVSVLCLGKVLQHPNSNEAWKNRVAGARSEKSYRDHDAVNGESTEFEWNIFPGFTTLQLCHKTNNLLSDLGQTPESFTGTILFISMFNDISCDRKGNKDECLANAENVQVFARRFGFGQWSFIGPGSDRKWYCFENSPQGACDNIAEQCCWNLQKLDILLSVPRLRCPGVS